MSILPLSDISIQNMSQMNSIKLHLSVGKYKNNYKSDFQIKDEKISPNTVKVYEKDFGQNKEKEGKNIYSL